MTRITKYLPRPALVVAIVGLMLATTGTAFAIGQFGVGKLKEGARQKVVGVGKLVNVTTTTNVPVTTAENPTTTVKATCPGFPIGNLQPISGGVKLEVKDPELQLLDSHAIANGWTATVYNNTAEPRKADVILSCARSIAVSGSALPTS
jgi:hypothetical protein